VAVCLKNALQFLTESDVAKSFPRIEDRYSELVALRTSLQQNVAVIPQKQPAGCEPTTAVIHEVGKRGVSLCAGQSHLSTFRVPRQQAVTEVILTTLSTQVDPADRIQCAAPDELIAARPGTDMLRR
jgi:hypothetical protein